MDTKTLYKNLLKDNGQLNFSYRQLKICLEQLDNRCEVCSMPFNPFNGCPVIIGNAQSAVCGECFAGINLLGFNVNNLSKAVLLINKLGPV